MIEAYCTYCRENAILNIIFFQGASLPVFTKYDNPASAEGQPLTRYLTYLALPAYNLGIHTFLFNMLI